ncbi:MAG: hypothetical protein ABIZ80_25230, partial [Bryobacteraceae bacterium]
MLTKRDFLKLPLAAGAAAMGAATRKDEYDADNTKIATLINAAAHDDHLLFLKQIGLRWLHVSFGKDQSYEAIKAAQERFARYGLKIHCGISETYRSVRLQLGQPGRDEDIEKFQAFVRDLGRAGVYSSKIDFHPANTYTTQMVETPRGYKA